MDSLVKLMSLCLEYYPKKKMLHALRVADYAYKTAKDITAISAYDAYLVGLAHDLIEDTDCPQSQLQEILGTDLFSAVVILTKDDNDDYNKYIHSILDSGDKLAILVKRADMKDHFMQTETLTDKLRDKYLPVVGLFL